VPGTEGNFRRMSTHTQAFSESDAGLSSYTEDDGINGDLSRQLRRREKKQKHIKQNKKNELDQSKACCDSKCSLF
jgi:hypothetical protein